MTQAAFILFALYALELLLLVATMSYAFILLSKKTHTNPHLKGNRLKMASVLPVLWFVYIYTDAYEVWQICEAANWQVNEASLEWKAARESLSAMGAFFTILLIAGYDFD